MIDSDEERDGEEGRGDSSSSSEEDPFFSGYEKHFMPTDADVWQLIPCLSTVEVHLKTFLF